MFEDQETGQEIHRITRLAKAAAQAEGHGFSGITAKIDYLLTPIPHWRIVSSLDDGQRVKVLLDGQGDVLSVELNPPEEASAWTKVKGWFGRK